MGIFSPLLGGKISRESHNFSFYCNDQIHSLPWQLFLGLDEHANGPDSLIINQCS